MSDLEKVLRRPLQALLISNDKAQREAILNGSKKITIREGWRDYEPGFVLFGCPNEPWCVGADITNVRYCLAREVTTEERIDDGFNSYRDMIAGMRRFYGGFNDNSEVTIIRWENVRGKLVEDYFKN